MREEDNCSGSITVFLSLILPLILSLIFVTIEGARISVAKASVNRLMVQAMDSVLAEYHAPLYEGYNIFALDSTYGTGEYQDENILNQYYKYLEFSTKNDNEKNHKYLDLMKVSLDKSELIDKTNLLDKDGQIFEYQILEHMKYRNIENLIEKIISGQESMSKAKEASYAYEKKLEMEEELAQIDTNILRLMSLFDGIKTKKNGIQVSKKNKLNIKSSFIKDICIGKVSMSNVAINNTIVFNSLKNKYYNPQDVISAMYSKADTIAEIESRRRVGGTSIDNLVKGHYEQINNYAYELSNKANNKLVMIDEAIETINQIKAAIDYADNSIDQYEMILLNKKDALGEYFPGLNEEISETREYVNINLRAYDFDGMITVLIANKETIARINRNIDLLRDYCVGKDYKAIGIILPTLEAEFCNYNIRDLALDYSSLVLNASKKTKSITKAIKDLIGDGILSLVMDTSKISEKVVEEDQLPSQYIEDTSPETDVLPIFKKLNLSEVFDISSIFGQFNSIEGMDTITNGLEQLYNKAMVIAYINLYFNDFVISQQEDFNQQYTFLSYEQEYILKGRKSDKENLSSVINQILLIRLILNLMTVVSDRDKRDTAELIAVSLVGFTGLTILVKIVKMVVLIILALMEGLIDISALLMDKSIPIIKSKSDFITEVSDILLISRTFIQTKAESIEKKDAFGNFNYNNYINLFILLKKKRKLLFNSLDIIQLNINLRNDKNFLIQNCLFDFKIHTRGKVHPKFFDLSHLNPFNNQSVYDFSYKQLYSY